MNHAEPLSFPADVLQRKGDVMARDVDHFIELLQTTHRRKVCAHKLWDILTDINFDPESHQGRVAVRYHAVEAAFNLAQALLQKYPREAGWILDQCEQSGEFLWWPRMAIEHEDDE